MLRHPERGSVTIVVAALWMGLFGMAALAVDAGHMYLTKRNLQDAADAAVMAGLPSLGSSTTTAQTNARNMAIKCGYPTGNITTTIGAAGAPSTLTVTITASEPFFFAKVLGYSSKTVTRDGRRAGLGARARGVCRQHQLHRLAGGRWVFSSTADPIDVTGDVESNGTANIYGSATISGSSTYGSGCTSNIGGAANTGGSLPYPYSYTAASFTCTYTQANWIFGQPGWFWQSGGPGGGGGTLMPGTYCATGDITVSGTCHHGQRDVHRGWDGNDQQQHRQPDGFRRQRHPRVLRRGQRLLQRAGDRHRELSVVLNGSFDAPNGCINASGSDITINGSLVGNEVQIGVGGTSSINATGGGGAGYWMYQ